MLSEGGAVVGALSSLQGDETSATHDGENHNQQGRPITSFIVGRNLEDRQESYPGIEVEL